MKISKETLNILKNFTNINQNFAFKPGNVVMTMSEGKNLIAEATISEDIQTEFGIYNLAEFLGVISLFDDPDLAFNDKYVTVGNKTSKIRYMATDLSVLRLPKRRISFESEGLEEVTSFVMTEDLYSKIVKTSAVLHCPDIWIEGNGKTLSIRVEDTKNTTSNNFCIDLGDTDKTFRAHIKIDTVRFIPNEYQVTISDRAIRFACDDLIYHVMLEMDSEV